MHSYTHVLCVCVCVCVLVWVCVVCHKKEWKKQKAQWHICICTGTSRRTTFSWPRRGWWRWGTSASPRCSALPTRVPRPCWVHPTTSAPRWCVPTTTSQTSLHWAVLCLFISSSLCVYCEGRITTVSQTSLYWAVLSLFIWSSLCVYCEGRITTVSQTSLLWAGLCLFIRTSLWLSLLWREAITQPDIFVLGCVVFVCLIITLCLLWRQNYDCEPDIFALGWAVFVYLIITLCLLWRQNYDCEPDIFVLGCVVIVYLIISLIVFTVKASTWLWAGHLWIGLCCICLLDRHFDCLYCVGRTMTMSPTSLLFVCLIISLTVCSVRRETIQLQVRHL